MENLEREQKIRAFIEGLLPEAQEQLITYYYEGTNTPDPDKSVLLQEKMGWNACRAEILEALKKADFEKLIHDIQ